MIMIHAGGIGQSAREYDLNKMRAAATRSLTGQKFPLPLLLDRTNGPLLHNEERST